MPAFPGKNVVSAASSQGVHGFQADAHAHQAAQKSRRHKAQKLAAIREIATAIVVAANNLELELPDDVPAEQLQLGE